MPKEKASIDPYHPNYYQYDSTWTNYIESNNIDTKFDNEDRAEGTEEDPYEISTAAQLASLAYRVNNNNEDFTDKYFVQTADINLGGFEWDPIDWGVNYDGQGHKIVGMQIIENSDNVIGLFSLIEDVNIKNVNLAGLIVCNNMPFVGGIVGSVEGSSTISNCTCNVHIFGTAQDYGSYAVVGGIVGFVQGGYLQISDCKNYSTITLNGGTVGGLVGDGIDGCEVSNCVNYGNIITNSCYNYTMTYTQRGGIVGRDADIIENCVNYGEVNACIDTLDQDNNISLGGITGRTDYSCIIRNCINHGDVCLSVRDLDIENYYEYSDFNNEYSANSINVGGIAGSATQIENCISDCTLTSPVGVGGIAGRCDEMTNCSVFGYLNLTNYNSLINSSKFSGLFVAQSNAVIAACSFFGGTSLTNENGESALGFCSEIGKESCLLTACYAQVNQSKYVSTSLDDSSWQDYWAIVPSLGNLPVQRGLYWLASAATTTMEEIAAALDGFVPF